jgi:hypothetical protein
MMKNDFESQLDVIRTELNENIKGKDKKEVAAAINENGKQVAEMYGIKIKQSV